MIAFPDPPAARAARSRRGFTLVELLVVIAVIVILMSLLVPTINAIMREVARAKVSSIIEGLSLALDQYHEIHGVYPPDKATSIHGDLDKSSECLVYFLSGGSIVWDGSSTTYPWRHALLIDTSDTGRRAMKVFYQFKEKMLVDFDGDHLPELVDPWQCWLIYNTGPGTRWSSPTATNQYGGPVHNVKRFDIFSAGPDRIPGNDDDVKNWDDSMDDRYDEIPVKPAGP